MFWKKESPKSPVVSEEFGKLYNLYVETSGKFSLLQSELKALKIEVDNLQEKFRRYRATNRPEDLSPEGSKSSGLPTSSKPLNTFNPFS